MCDGRGGSAGIADQSDKHLMGVGGSTKTRQWVPGLLFPLSAAVIPGLFPCKAFHGMTKVK